MTLHIASILSLQDHSERRVRLSEILDIVCREYQLPHRIVVGPTREAKTARARFAFYYLARFLAQRSYGQVAVKVNRGDHAAMHGAKKVHKDPTPYQPELSRCIAELQHKSISEPQPAASPHLACGAAEQGSMAISAKAGSTAATGAVPQVASAPVAPPISRVLP